jgi:carbonic anhydrase
MLGDVKYKLLQVHFHRPSEHMIGGKNFPMEAHFVHRNEAGGLAVVGVLIAEGRPNAAFGKIVKTMPAAEGPAVKADAGIDPHALLPHKLGYFRYPGSLTTPPCSEVVEWLLLTTPIQVSSADVAAFAKLYPMNARPVQKDNRRYVLRSG